MEKVGNGSSDFTLTMFNNMARDYIEKYIETIYLYRSNDLNLNTVKAVVTKESTNADIADTMQKRITLDSETTTVANLCDNISHFQNIAEYYRYTRSAQDIVRLNFSHSSTVLDTQVNDDCVTVYLYTEVTFQYEEGGEPAVCGDRFAVKFGKINDQWCIVDVISEEMVAYGLTKDKFNLERAIASFDKLQATQDVAAVCDDVQTNALDGIGEQEESELFGINVPSTVGYNRNNAIAYAYTYTTSSYTASNGNNPDFLNNNFFDYGSLGGNCQNFASQCVWAGLGGSDEPSSIDNYKFPMDRTGSNEWYGDKRGNKSSSWATTDYFYEYLEASSRDKTGIHMNGFTYELSAGKNFASIPNPLTLLPGSILHVNGESRYGHAIVVTEASGTRFCDVKFCSNSPMRKAVKLSDCASFINGPIRVMIPTGMTKNDICNHSSHSYASSSTGTSCYCVNCGACKLKATGKLSKPIRVGTTTAVQGSANVVCFRLAIGITDPNGKTTWKEFTKASSASRDYTFSQRGPYTIVFAARDVSTSEAHSMKVSHTYKVRVY